MPDVEQVQDQFITFPEEEQYYDLRFECVLPLYVRALQEGWTLTGPEDEITRETGLPCEQLPTPVSEECKEFCDSQGLSFVLAKCLNKAKELFSNIVKLSAELDYFRDDQAENTAHVVIRVEVNSDQETALREYDQWICWMATNVAPSDIDFFTLTVRRV